MTDFLHFEKLFLYFLDFFLSVQVPIQNNKKKTQPKSSLNRGAGDTALDVSIWAASSEGRRFAIILQEYGYSVRLSAYPLIVRERSNNPDLGQTRN
jgi:hypothetical protein